MPQNISRSEWDVIVVGGGPAGSVSAAVCAKGGMRVLVLERSRFPRDKVCGDCLNPLAWPVLERLGLGEAVVRLPHARLQRVEFMACDGETASVVLPLCERGEIAIRRRDLDQLLLECAEDAGADVRQETAVSAIRREDNGWRLETSTGTVCVPFLIAADGRNSTVARLLNLMPKSRRDRVSIQMHLPLPSELRGSVRMQFLPEGYSGIADIGDGHANLCLVSRPENLDRLRASAIQQYGIAEDQQWRSITPLSRSPIAAFQNGVMLVGDAARVVEPFTGEGIAYAMRTGELAAETLLSSSEETYAEKHAALYRGRLWLNHVARFACLHPFIASQVVRGAKYVPGLLTLLTQKVIKPGADPALAAVATP